MTRKPGSYCHSRKRFSGKESMGVGSMSETVPIKVFVYDILALNGENLITKPFRERRKLLRRFCTQGSFAVSGSRDCFRGEKINRIKAALFRFGVGRGDV